MSHTTETDQVVIDDDTRSIFDSLRRVVRALHVQTRVTRQALGLTGAQLGVLDVLGAHRGGLTASELASRVLTQTASLSASLRKLTALGLARKAPDARDARRMLIEITRDGAQALARAGGSVQLKLLRALSQMSAAERHDMSRLLRSWATKAKLHPSTFLLMEEEEEKEESEHRYDSEAHPSAAPEI